MSSVRWTRGLLEAAGTILYPPHCAVCSRALGRGRAVLCRDCRRSLPRLAGPRCEVCGEPYSGALAGAFRCMNCGDRELAFEFATTAFRSRGPVRDLIHQFKYRGRHHLRHILARMLWRGFLDPRVVRLGIDAIVPVPLHAARRRDREFNQSEVLARLAGRRLGLPVRDCLRRIRHTRTQTHFHREERFENLEGAFALRAGADVSDLSLALVDDVLTTGSTADACARALLDGGAAVVVVITVARG
jgi:competence protein ComFC